MEKLASESLPAGYGTEWTGIAFQQKAAANTAGIAFALAVLFVFLVLAAQSESLVLPLSIILIVPMCLLAELISVHLRGPDNDYPTQVGHPVHLALGHKIGSHISHFGEGRSD